MGPPSLAGTLGRADQAARARRTTATRARRRRGDTAFRLLGSAMALLFVRLPPAAAGRCVASPDSLRRVQPIRFLKESKGLLDVVGLFDEALGVPLAARDSEEVAPIHVNRAGQAPDRIDHRVNDVTPERHRVAVAQGLCACGLDPATGIIGHAAPEDVVLTAGIDADNGPHLVVMRHDSHPWPPDDVEDRELGRAVEHLGSCALRLAQDLQNLARSGDRASDDFAYGLLPHSLSAADTAVGDEPVQIKHVRTLLGSGVRSHNPTSGRGDGHLSLPCPWRMYECET